MLDKSGDAIITQFGIPAQLGTGVRMVTNSSAADG